jgi:hypothetical protein
VLAEDLNANLEDSKLALSKKAAPIEDELINSDIFPKILPEYIRENTPITDDIIIPYATEGMTIRLWAIKSGKRNKVTIDDELVTPKLVARVGNMSILKKCQKTKIEDNLAKNHISLKGHRKINPKTDYDFTKAQIPVKLKIIKNLTTKHHVLEGDSILFKTTNEVLINGTTLPKGTEVIGRVETISASDKMGTPANIVVDNFYVKDHPEISLYGNVSKTGANRSIWVYPLYQAGNIMFYVAGFVFVPIHGGHAKLLTSDTYTVFYETH